MIATQTPFRVSFIGGGTDMEDFYSVNQGCVISTTINKYMYIFVHPFFDNRIQVKYSVTELVESIDKIKHPIVKVALKKFNISGIDINSIADVPAGTGLGSSSSYTVGLLHALYAYVNKYPSRDKLAKEASEIEIDILKEPIGKQDQYASSYGGLNCITFQQNGDVNVEPIIMPRESHCEFEESILLFYIGGTRNARDILRDQKKNISKDKTKIKDLIRLTGLVKQFKECLELGSLSDIGALLDESWRIKKNLSRMISDERIDYYYSLARKNGALGGKLLGAGNSGFLMLYCAKQDQEKLKHALRELTEMKIRFDKFGSKVIYVNYD